MRILLVEARPPAEYSPFAPNHYGLGAAYLASTLRRELDGTDLALRIVHKDVEKEIRTFDPHVVAISSITVYFDMARQVAHLARSMGKPVVLGGVHITLLPNSLTRDMDVAVLGEGERTFTELIRLFRAKDAFLPDDLKKINGIAFWEGETLRKTEPRALVDPLDEIPIPARDLLQINKRNLYLISARGCPFRCVFCVSSRLWARTRFHSPERVVEEIRQVYTDYQPSRILFEDDLFTIKKSRLRQIVELIQKEGLNRKIKFGVLGKANTIDDEMCSLLKRMNVIIVAMGLESGCQRTLSYLKPRAKLEDNQRALELLHKHDLISMSNFIIGSPEETREEILQTYHWIRRSKLTYLIGTAVLTPFPGTPVWDRAEARGLVSDDMEWSKLDMDWEKHHEQAICVSEVLTKEEVYQLYMRFKRLKVWFSIKAAFTMIRKDPVVLFRLARFSREILKSLLVLPKTLRTASRPTPGSPP